MFYLVDFERYLQLWQQGAGDRSCDLLSSDTVGLLSLTRITYTSAPLGLGYEQLESFLTIEGRSQQIKPSARIVAYLHSQICTIKSDVLRDALNGEVAWLLGS